MHQIETFVSNTVSRVLLNNYKGTVTKICFSFEKTSFVVSNQSNFVFFLSLNSLKHYQLGIFFNEFAVKISKSQEYLDPFHRFKSLLFDYNFNFCWVHSYVFINFDNETQIFRRFYFEFAFVDI